MSPNRHDEIVDTGALLVWLATVDQARTIATHQHDNVHQLAWASEGVLSIGVAERTWVLPRSRALWIPAGVEHDVTATGPTTMVSLYFDIATCPIDFVKPVAIKTVGLLGALIEHLTSELNPDERTRAEAVVFDLLEPLPTTTLHVPIPIDDRALAVWEILQSNPADQRTLQQFGTTVGASGRTLARILERDIAMSFGPWRTRIRIAAALPMLAADKSISSVADAVGYGTASAFVAAFKRTTGTTPGRHF